MIQAQAVAKLPPAIADEILATEQLIRTLERLAGENEAFAVKYRQDAGWHRLRVERLKGNTW